MKKRKSIATFGIALILASALGARATTPIAAHGASQPLPTLRWYGLVGTHTWTPTLDPSGAEDSISIYITYMVDANLVKVLPSGQIGPDLATWTVSRDHLHYFFTIRRNARFSNDDPVTAQDAAFSITRALAKSTNSPVALTYLKHIKGAAALNSGKAARLAGVRVLSSRRIEISLDKPIAFFLGALSYPTADVLDRRIVAGKPPRTYLTDTCSANVGAGPFMFVCRNKSGTLSSFFPPGTTPSITLVPNPYYYGRKPHIRVVMQAIADAQTNYRVFQANGIDVTYLPTAEIARNRNKPGFYSFPTSTIDYITPNVRMRPFNNVHCRLAVSYAINRDAINNDVLHHSQATVYDVLPRGMLGYYNGQDNPHFDLKKARQELAQCPGGIHNVQVAYEHASSDLDAEYSALSNMWQAAGIDIKPRPLTYNDWINVVTQPLNATHTPIAQNLWYQDYPDPQDYCTLLLRGGESLNVGQWNDPAYNKLVDEAEVTFDRAKRAALYREAQHIALSQGAWITIGNQNGYDMVKPWVHGLVGTEPFVVLMPRNNDWANVWISPH